MGRVNPLALDFLLKHPSDCARTLEQLPVNTTCSLIRSIQPAPAAGVLECMVTSYGSECLYVLEAETSASIFREMKMPHAARLLRAIPSQSAINIIDSLPAYVRNNIQSALRYPEETVGRIMDSNPFSLPDSISVSEALKRLKNLRGRNIQEIFIVDDDHKLKGAVHVPDLLSAQKSSSLHTIVIGDVPSLSTRASYNTAAVHAGWQNFGTLPVVQKDNILSGVLKSSTLLHIMADASNKDDNPDPLNDLFSVTGMYWTVLAELVNSATSFNKEKRE